MPTNDPPSKNWWSLSKASSGKGLRQDSFEEKPFNRLQSNAVKAPGFKSFAEAIWLKPKKQSQPLSVSFHSPSTVPDPVKYSSLTLSPADSVGPHTPFDSRGKPRQSVLTLADDPFAGNAPVIPISVSRSPTDPSRLSAHSSSSGTDLASRKTDSPLNRTSYASSSTTNSHGVDNNSPVSVGPPQVLPEAKRHHLRLKRSVGSFPIKMPDQRQSSFVPHATFDPLEDSGLKDTAQRPKLRSRGMTDGGLSHKAGFFVQDQKRLRNSSQISTTSNILPMTTTKSANSIPTPRVVVRQASSSRLQAPPTSPPTKSLPAAPPSPVDQPDPRQRKGLESLPVSSCVPSVHDSTLGPFYNNNLRSQRDLRNPEDSIMEIAEPSSTSPPSRMLKKASSQRSLGRRLSPSSSRITVAAEQPSDKRKQWNFPNARLPVPNLPLSIRTSCSPNSSSQASSGDLVSPVSVTEPKKSRKRLFSTQSRPSTSTCVPTNPKEDDTLSVASTRSDHDSSYIPWKVTRNYPKPSSFWEEGPDTTPTSPNETYHPQAIMSRDELAELDATVSRMAESHRQASQSSESSVISSSMASCSFPALVPKEAVEEPDPVGLSPPPLRRRSVRMSCSTVLSVKSHLDSPRHPVAADPFIRTDVEDSVFDKSPSCFPDGQQDSTSGMTSLSPPPRPRLRSTNSARSTSTFTTTNSTERLNPLNAKVSERPNATKGPSLQPTTSSTTTSLRTPSSSVRKQAGVSRTKTRGSGGGGVTLEKAIHRSSIMRKPSFLEIDVESEHEAREKRDSLFLSMKASTAAGSASTAPNGSKAETGESFLDLARESFDTIRS